MSINLLNPCPQDTSVRISTHTISDFIQMRAIVNRRVPGSDSAYVFFKILNDWQIVEILSVLFGQNGIYTADG